MGEGEARQMAGQHAMGVQRALGRAGGARGEDHQRRIVGERIHHVERLAVLRHDRRQVFRVAGGAVRAEDGGEGGQGRADLGEPRQAGGIGDDGLRARSSKPIAQRIDAEERCQRHGDGAELVGGEMADNGLYRLGEKQGDAIAGRDAAGAERMGERVRLPLEFAIGRRL